MTMSARRPRLDRYGIDRVARAVVTGRRGYGPSVDRLADFVAGRMTARLAAAGLADRIPSRLRIGSAAVCDRGTEAILLERARKHLAAAVAARADDGTRTR